MSVFSTFFKRTLTPAWSFSCRATMWRILLSDRGRIAGECRDHEQKKTEFFCLDEGSGALLWRHVRPEESWWVGLEAVHADRVLLHGFESPDMPEHKRIFALDLETGEEVWRNDELTFWFAYGSKIYTYRTMFEKRTWQILNAGNGEVLEEVENSEDLMPVRELARGEDVHHQVDFPEFVERDSAPPDVLVFLGQETKNHDLVGGVESVVKDRYAVVNYYCQAQRSEAGGILLESRIAVYDRQERRRVFSDVLVRNARAPVPDAFFVKDSLFFIKDQKTLSMVPLPDNDGTSLS